MQLWVISCETRLQFGSASADDAEVNRICGMNV